ncbi:MutS protein msh5, partial [Ancistrocladus abbreviatus]
MRFGYFCTFRLEFFHLYRIDVGEFNRHATSRSLCLLDEFGKGTLTKDGIGLLGGTIAYFAASNNPPK